MAKTPWAKKKPEPMELTDGVETDLIVEEEKQENPKELKKKEPKKAAPKGGIVVGNSHVDFTPKIFRDGVEARASKRRWILGNIALLVACGIVGGALFGTTIPLNITLDSATSSNLQLQTALAQYADLTNALEQKTGIENKLNIAAGGEINWTALLGDLESHLPSGTIIQSIAINQGDPASGIGASILLSFQANSPLGYADTLNAVENMAGISNVKIGGMTSSGETYSFSSTMNYDISILTNRYPSPNAASAQQQNVPSLTEDLPEETFPEDLNNQDEENQGVPVDGEEEQTNEEGEN